MIGWHFNESLRNVELNWSFKSLAQRTCKPGTVSSTRCGCSSYFSWEDVEQLVLLVVRDLAVCHACRRAISTTSPAPSGAAKCEVFHCRASRYDVILPNLAYLSESMSLLNLILSFTIVAWIWWFCPIGTRVPLQNHLILKPCHFLTLS